MLKCWWSRSAAEISRSGNTFCLWRKKLVNTGVRQLITSVTCDETSWFNGSLNKGEEWKHLMNRTKLFGGLNWAPSAISVAAVWLWINTSPINIRQQSSFYLVHWCRRWNDHSSFPASWAHRLLPLTRRELPMHSLPAWLSRQPTARAARSWIFGQI